MKKLVRACAATCALNLGVSLAAQTAGDTPSHSAETASAQVMVAALNLRQGIAQSVKEGTITPAEAIGQLRSAYSPSGLQLPPAADFAYAAVEVGERLVVKKPAAAEPFFQAAESSLDQLIEDTADAQAAAKAQYLQERSWIRGRYLNRAVEAKADIDRAIDLRPDDKDLRRARLNLLRLNGLFVPTNPKG